MGCDIHLFVEKRTEAGYVGVPAPGNWNNDRLEFSAEPSRFKGGDWFWDRNYALFAWLAGVRNSENNTPLSDPRGLPLDAAPETRASSDEYGIDGHSHTFFTLSELAAAGKATPLTHGGAVPEEYYKKWRESGEDFPDSWCAATNGQTVPESEYKDGDFVRTGRPLYVECAWTVSVERSFARFFKFLAGVREVAGPDARIVFFFDN